jgi:hypothetical protein
MSRSACLAASILALLCAGLFVGGAGAQSSVRSSAPNPVAFDCAGPSATDVANSDFFWYWPCASFLHVSVNPSGDALGYVRSTPYAIDCPHACTRPFTAGTKVTLTAYPSNGASFVSWSGDACAGQGNPCVATVSGDTQVTANFDGVAIPPETAGPLLTLTSFLGFVFPFGTVTGSGNYSCVFTSCSGTYAPGTTVTLTASGISSPYFFCDATTGLTQHPSPYTFAITSSHAVSPRPSGGSC